jgi:1,2-diacylglycerol 3-alpha-glucosyltransferase
MKLAHARIRRGAEPFAAKSVIVQTLRIALFTECYRPIQNGIVAAVDALSVALRARGHEVVCVTPTMPGYRGDDASVVRIPSLPLPAPTAYRLTLPFLPYRALERAEHRPSIVHAHSAFVTGWMAIRAARRFRVPLVFTYHTRLEDYAHYIPFETRTTRGAAVHLTKTYANAADAVLVPTPAMERHLRAIGVTSRIEVIPSGIDVGFFAGGARRDDVRARLGAGPGDLLVLSVGRLAKEKNLELALGAFAELRLPAARMAIVGAGPERERLASLAVKLGISTRTHFAGELLRRELPDTYASADVFLFSSTSETQGLVLVDALASGLPLVAVDTPQTRDVVGAAGSLVPADAASLARALEAVLSAERRTPAGAADRFDQGRVVDRVLEVYVSLRAVASRAG